MEFPGEKLVIRLLETVEKSGTGLLRPWQIKRIARAESEAKNETAYAGLITEKNLALLKVLTFNNVQSNTNNGELLIQGVPRALIEASMVTHLNDRARRQTNLESTLEKAKISLQSDNSDPPDEFIEMDWFFRWRDNAEGISNELMQQIWGNVLAGEVKSPGTFSLRTLDFLKNLSQSEAKTIESVAPFVINGYALIFGSGLHIGDDAPQVKFKNVPDDHHITRLEELGLVNTGLGLGSQFGNSTELSNGFFGWMFYSIQRAVAATSIDRSKQIRLSFYQLTTLGRDVLQLVKTVANEDHLKELALYIANEGFDSEIMDYERISNSKITLKNIERIWPPSEK